MALIVGFFRALFQLRDRRFRRALVRSVAYSAFFIAAFGLCAGWLVTLLPDAVALPLIGKVTVPLIGAVTVPMVGELAVPLRQVEGLNLPLLVMISSLLMFPTAGAVANLMLDEIVDTVETRDYPHLSDLRPSGSFEAVTGAAAFSVLVLVVNLGALIFYVVAGALAPLIFWSVNGFLIGREFFTLVAGRRLPPDDVAALRRTHAWRIWLGGCLMAVPLSLPLIGLVIPVLGTAMHTHMFHRVWRSERRNRPGTGKDSESEISVAPAKVADHAEMSGEARPESMADRFGRLKARYRLKHLKTSTEQSRGSNHERKKRLVALACLLRGLPPGRLRELTESRRINRDSRSLSDVERLALALASGEKSAAEALLRATRSPAARKATATDEILAQAYEEWQEIQASSAADPISTGAKNLEAFGVSDLGQYSRMN